MILIDLIDLHSGAFGHTYLDAEESENIKTINVSVIYL